jgi:hypothetical protein
MQQMMPLTNASGGDLGKRDLPCGRPAAPAIFKFAAIRNR